MTRQLHRPDGPPLSPKAHQIADLLREAEDGLTLAELGAAIGSRYLKRVVEGMQRGPYTIGEEDGRLILVAEPSTEASDEGRPAAQKGTGPVLAGTITQASGASVDGSADDLPGQLFPMPSTSHWAADREAA